MPLLCPRCGKTEMMRRKVSGGVWVLFECLFAALLLDENDEFLQKELDAWERSGGMKRWLKEPLDSPQNVFVKIEDPQQIKKMKKQFDKLWREAKPLKTRRGEARSVEGDKG
jgi:hypothetical protein